MDVSTSEFIGARTHLEYGQEGVQGSTSK